jgi:hypothetical protein
MSTTVELVHDVGIAAGIPEEPFAAGGEAVTGAAETAWTPMTAAREQVRALVQQVFYPGLPTPARHVMFCGIDRNTDMGNVCEIVARDLAALTQKKVCLVPTNGHSTEQRAHLWNHGILNLCEGGESEKRQNGSRQICENLWLRPFDSFCKSNEALWSAAWIRGWLSELRRTFDYSVIQAPGTGLSSEAALLGLYADGLILVLEAHRTRRMAAKRAQEMLRAANVRLLGTVLNRRTFPIPESLYRRL